MKTVLVFALLVLGINCNSQTVKQSPIVEKTVVVHGDCDMCKSLIEKTASYVKGVKKATWDKDKQILTVIFREDKTTLPAIETAIAKAGYDTENVKADEEAYQGLPTCCHYRVTEKH